VSAGRGGRVRVSAAAWALVLALAAVARAQPIAPLDPMPARLLRTLAHDPQGYSPAGAKPPTDLLLGDLLFHTPRVLGARARALGMSCQTCHPNGATHRAFALPGVHARAGSIDLTSAHFRAGADDGVDNAVDIPSLRGARYTGPYGRDGRTASLAEFVAGVVSAEFDGAPLEPTRLRALVRYVQDLDFLPNRNVDARGRLTERASAAARRGERAFFAPRDGLHGASCATCHDPSTYFRDGRVHRLASGARASPYGFDDGYETPTLLGTAETAPYFHDGRFATLGDVVRWFDATFELGLAGGERDDLTAYLEAVGAVEPAADDRPLGERLVQTFAYLRLLDVGEARDDRVVWLAALEAITAEIDHAPAPPTAAGPNAANATNAANARLRSRIGAARARIVSLASRAEHGAALTALRPEIAPLLAELTRLAADWTGALPRP
jgi:Di-haem cytochrome c peroxidase